MSWLTDLVRPKIRTTSRKEVAANVWEKCPSCGTLLYNKDLTENFRVCTSCNHHLRLPVSERLALLADAESIKEVDVPAPKSEDPLKFKDSKKYTDRMKAARKKTGADEAYRVVRATLKGRPVVLAVMDFSFMGGSMGQAMGNAIVTAANTARENQLPLIVVSASGGARMQEGILSLMQMARTTAALVALKESGMPYVVLLTDPTTGGVTASFAMQGDLLLAEPGALIGFAGPRVIQQTIGETLPEGFQRAEYLLEHGMLDRVVSRNEQKDVLSSYLNIFLHSKK